MSEARSGGTATAVALVSCSGILGDAIRHSLMQMADMTVVADLNFDGIDRLSRTLRNIRPDVVVWLMDNDFVLVDHPEVFGADRGCAVISVLDDGRRGAAWAMRPCRTDLAAPSLDTLVDTLRAVSIRP